MGETTAIAWADHTFNTHWGCTKIEAPGDEPSECDHCYAETLSIRFGYSDTGSKQRIWGADAPRRRLSDAYWRDPLKWDRLAREAGRQELVFCASMADVFEARDDLDDVRARLYELIDQTPNLIWMLLTKRPEQVLPRVPPRWIGLEQTPEGLIQIDPAHLVPPRYISPSEWYAAARRPEAKAAWPANVWVGTSAGTQRSLLRVQRLIQIPAPVLFVSCEPLFERVTFTDEQLERIGWVIAGGESGPGHRPMLTSWARHLRDQCDARRAPCEQPEIPRPHSVAVPGGGRACNCEYADPIPFFFKQTGGLHGGDDQLDGRTYKNWPAAAGDRTWALEPSTTGAPS